MKDGLGHLRLLIDIISIKCFVALCGRNNQLLDSHLFFYHRYFALAAYHDAKGRTSKADALYAIAEAHYQAAPGSDDDDPLTSDAMAMPVPEPPGVTDAVMNGFSARRSGVVDRLHSATEPA